MASPALLLGLGMPIAMAVSGVVAWRASKQDSAKPENPTWRDDSLDDWRKERDAAQEEQRATRSTPQARAKTVTGSEEQQETAKKHQRLGG